MRLRAAFASLVVVTGLAAAPPKGLVDEIEAIAAGEPPILGIDTQIRAGEILRVKEPVLARRFLLDALSRTQALNDGPTRGHFVPQIAGALTRMDRRTAETACQTLPRRSSEGDGDALSDCFTAVAKALEAWPDKAAAARLGIASGAFDSPVYEDLIASGLGSHVAEATALYSAFVDGFPEDGNPAEIRRLLGCVRKAGPVAPAISRQALERAFRAIRSSKFQAGKTKAPFGYKLKGRAVETSTVREALMFQVAALAPLIAPDMVERYESELGSFQNQVAGVRWNDLANMKEEPNAADKKETGFYEAPPKKEISIDKLSFDEALDALRKEKEAFTRVAGFLDLIDKKAEPVARRKSIASEALADSNKMPVDGDRLIVQSMLTRRFWIFEDRQQASLAAGYLAETFRLLCRCDDAGCDSLRGREYCAEQIHDFAEYLVENHLSAEELGLSNRSLRARVLLVELASSLK